MKTSPKNFFEDRTKVILGLLIPAFLLYAKSIKFEFTTMDEQWMIVESTTFLQKWENLKSVFLIPIAKAYYRPVFWMTFIFEYHIGKISPVIYHLSNVLWYLASVLLLFKFLTVFKIDKKTAFVCSLIFSAHPLLVHAVAWVPGRNDTMLCVFSLASVIYLDKFLSGSQKKSVLLHFLFFICALLTKENAVVLPLIYFGFVKFFKNIPLKPVLLYSAVWLVIIAIWLLCRHNAVKDLATQQVDFALAVKNFGMALILFAGKVLIPVQQSVYPTLRHMSVTPGILSLLFIIFLCFKPGLKNKYVAFLGLCMFFVLLAIPIWYGVSRGAPDQYEHRAYTSLVGLILFFSQVKFDLRATYFKYAIYALIIFFFVKTYTRMDVYKNGITFAQTGIKECPDFYLFHFQLGEIYYKTNEFNKSIPHINRAIELQPNMHKLYNNRGSSYYNLGLLKEAIADFDTAIQKAGFTAEYYRNRCLAYYHHGEIENSMRDLYRIRKTGRTGLAPEIEMEITKKWSLLFDQVNNGVARDPRNAELYYRRASLLFDAGDTETGLKDIRMACELAPGNEKYRELLHKYYVPENK